MQDFITMSNRELHRAEIVQKLIDKRLLEIQRVRVPDTAVATGKPIVYPIAATRQAVLGSSYG